MKLTLAAFLLIASPCLAETFASHNDSDVNVQNEFSYESVPSAAAPCTTLPAPSTDGQGCAIVCCTGPRAPGPTCIERCSF